MIEFCFFVCFFLIPFCCGLCSYLMGVICGCFCAPLCERCASVWQIRLILNQFHHDRRRDRWWRGEWDYWESLYKCRVLTTELIIRVGHHCLGMTNRRGDTRISFGYFLVSGGSSATRGAGGIQSIKMIFLEMFIAKQQC